MRWIIDAEPPRLGPAGRDQRAACACNVPASRSVRIGSAARIWSGAKVGQMRRTGLGHHGHHGLWDELRGRSGDLASFAAPEPLTAPQRIPSHLRLTPFVGTFLRDLVYALRKLARARVFTATAVLTLALGIGGTTAIFTLIHAVMLKSLPVGDPSRLYRIGDGDNCCVQGGPQDRWGMFSYPAVRAAQGRGAGVRGAHGVSGGRRSPERAPAGRGRRAAAAAVDLRHRQLLHDARRQRVRRPRVLGRRRCARRRLRSWCWPITPGRESTAAIPSIVGATLVVEGQPFTVAGVAPPGSSARRSSADPPDLWVPLQQEPLIAGAETSLLRQPISAWLRVIGRLRPGATIDGIDARLTGAAPSVDAARGRLPRELDAGRSSACCRSR